MMFATIVIIVSLHTTRPTHSSPPNALIKKFSSWKNRSQRRDLFADYFGQSRCTSVVGQRPIITDVAWSRSCHKRERMNRSSCRSESGLVRPKQPCARLGPDPPRKRTLLGVMLGHGQICSRTIFSTLFARLLQRCGFWLAVCCGPGGK